MLPTFIQFQGLIHFAFLCTFMGIKLAVKRIVGGKWGPCSGQACIGIDYLLVEEQFSSSLVFITITSCYFFLNFCFLIQSFLVDRAIKEDNQKILWRKPSGIKCSFENSKQASLWENTQSSRRTTCCRFHRSWWFDRWRKPVSSSTCFWQIEVVN